MNSFFNIIEIIPSKINNYPKVIGVLLENKEFCLIKGEDSIENFKALIKKNFRKKKKNIIFYTFELGFIFPSLLKIHEGGIEKIKFFAIKNSIYYLKICVGGKVILIKNASKYLPEMIEEEGRLRQLGFYPEEDSVDLSSRQYLQNDFNKGVKDYLKIMEVIKPKSSNQVIHIKSFYKEGEIVEEVKEKIENIYVEIKKNVINLEIFLKKLNKEISILNNNWFFTYSLSSVSAEIFEKFFNNYQVEIRLKTELDKEIRPSFFGGRCEVFGNFYKDEEKIYHFDFENMYGEIMKSDFPTGELKFLKYVENINKPGFYYVKVKSYEMKIPVLPFKIKENIDESIWGDKIEGDVLFLNGEFEGLYYSEELKTFENAGGRIIEIKYGYVFEKSNKPIFKEFSEELIELRRKRKSKIWKIMLVSFYGRLGMSPSKTEIMIGDRNSYEKDIKEKNIKEEVWLGDTYLAEVFKEKESEEVNSNVIYASIITSKARIKLWENMTEVEKNEGRVLYCDTDSVFAAFPKKKEILGKKMKDIYWDENKEKTVIDEAVFAGTRSYSIKIKENWETKIAGMPRNSISYEDFYLDFYSKWNKNYRIIQTKKNIFKTENWRVTTVINIKNYGKRKFSIDKKKTKPFILINQETFEDPNVKF